MFFEACQTRGPHTVHNLVGFSPASSDPRFLPHELKWRGGVLPSALQLSPIVSSWKFSTAHLVHVVLLFATCRPQLDTNVRHRRFH